MNDRSSSKNKPVTLDTVLSFGQYKGATIEWVVENDPSYILWLDEKKVLKIPDDIIEQALELNDAIRRDGYDEWGNPNNPGFWGLDFGDDD